MDLKYDILNIAAEAKKAKEKDCKIINATLGAFYNEEGKFKSYNTVKCIIDSLEDEKYYAYSPIDGGKDYHNAVLKWVFRNCEKEFKALTNIRVVSTPGGTGAVFASLMESLNVDEEVLIADLCWEPYLDMVNFNKFKAKRYQMFNSDMKFNVNDCINKCNEIVLKQNKLVWILNDPCNNPTGYTIDLDEFKKIIEYISTLTCPVYLIYDIAYGDYCLNNSDQHEKLKLLASLESNVTTFIAFSASKTFCTYGMRLGAQIIMSHDEERVLQIYSKSCEIGRTHWSNISTSGINMLVKLVNDATLHEKFRKELKLNKEILIKRINVFLDEANSVGLKVYKSNGGFFLNVPSLDPIGVYEKMKQKGAYVVPLETSIRIAVCSVSIDEMHGLASMLKEVIGNEQN